MHELHDQAHPCHSHPPFVPTSIVDTGLKPFLAPLPAALLAVPSGSTGRIQYHTMSSPERIRMPRQDSRGGMLTKAA